MNNVKKSEYKKLNGIRINRLLLNAYMIACKAHKGQKDKGGNDYIYHPIFVAFKCNSIETKIVAFLHDVLEDSSYDVKSLEAIFPKEIVDAVCIITKDNKSYYKYLKLVKSNELSRTVKINDIKHNMNMSRLNKIRLIDIKRYLKYFISLLYLKM